MSFNNKYFPVPDYKFKVRQGLINEKQYGEEKEKELLPIFKKLIEQYEIKLRQDKSSTFLDKWYLQHVREEIEFVFDEIKKIQNSDTKKIISIISVNSNYSRLKNL